MHIPEAHGPSKCYMFEVQNPGCEGQNPTYEGPMSLLWDILYIYIYIHLYVSRSAHSQRVFAHFFTGELAARLGQASQLPVATSPSVTAEAHVLDFEESYRSLGLKVAWSSWCGRWWRDSKAQGHDGSPVPKNFYTTRRIEVANWGAFGIFRAQYNPHEVPM